jgi:hypothetical protein
MPCVVCEEDGILKPVAVPIDEELVHVLGIVNASEELVWLAGVIDPDA